MLAKTLLLTVALSAACQGYETPTPTPTPASVKSESQRLGTRARFQAVSVVGASTVWISGVDGTFARSLDGGESWTLGVVEGEEERQFRDVHALDAMTAYLLSSGPGEQSRILHTSDGGTSWTTQYVNDEPEGFLDCFAFWDDESGIVYGDSVAGRLVVLRTTDGTTWHSASGDELPRARDGEGGFAASGTCVVTVGESTAFIGTGAGSARVLRTGDRGLSFEVFETPVFHATETAGVTSLAFWDESHGMAAGGDVASDGTGASADPRVATTSDAGRTWRVATSPPFPGAIYGIAHVPGSSPPAVVAVGPGGVAVSRDGGESWTRLSDESTWSVAFSSIGHGFLVGPEGRVTTIGLSSPNR